MKTWKRKVLLGAALLLSVPLALAAALLANSYVTPFPEELERTPQSGRRIEDRDGMLLARTRAADDVWRVPLQLQTAGPHLAAAMVAAEDKRFHHHPGVDPLSVMRAGAQALRHGRLVSGASTITQQLARSTFERPRTLLGKWQEMALALRIERQLTKGQILEEYLNRVSFGPNIVGARAAADHYFGKPLSALDLSEAATLAALVRAPSAFDPRNGTHHAKRERNRVLRRMWERGSVSSEARKRAESLPITVRQRPPLPGAHHWVRWVASQGTETHLKTTLLGSLQHEAEEVIRQQTALLNHRGVSASAAVILENKTGDILAYVGSPEFESSDGQNDGVRALRQPGSTLKPFAYALAIERLTMTPATLLPDEPLHFRTNQGHYAPKNFDRSFRGSVRLSRALANSLNVPAVYVVDKLGVPAFLSQLHELGFTTLTEAPHHYGPALALGDGEVRLLDLASAYSTLARGGTRVAPRLFLSQSPEKPRQVFSPETSALITEILSDDRARREAFGASNALDLEFPVAAKTGTSKGFRDSWTVGYTREVTVAVWAGNFDGRATKRVSGAVGAGLLFRSLMRVATKHKPPSPRNEDARPLHDVALEQQTICATTGASATASCRQPVTEWFAKGRLPDRVQSPSGATEIAFPRNGMVFTYDPAIPAHRQRLILRANGEDVSRATLQLNGTPLPTVAGRSEWPLRPGRFELVAVGQEGPSSPISFTVEARREGS